MILASSPLHASAVDPTASDLAILDPGAALALDALGIVRARLRRVRDDLESVRATGARLGDDTAWRARAAERYRTGLARWRDGLTEVATRLDSLDGELQQAEVGLAIRGGTP
ncbi:hypothetical protein [Microbacterium oleivorans]|uniref:hypothetical protein n=1 Tax=Microbacterium oleivorans TaxID=273677 RepID=UPI0021172462|nr:hypothetical protein [Microbacterium oleivorans]